MNRRGKYYRGRPQATVIGHTVDMDEQRWAVRERRPTRHGFDIELGWHEDRVPGPGRKGVGAPRVILTKPLARYLLQTPRNADIDLPIAHGVLARCRKAVRMDRSTQRAHWWNEHLDELKRLDNATFAARFDLQTTTVMSKRRALLGRSQRKRPEAWWRQAEVLRVLDTLPARDAAERFGVTADAINYWKRRLRRAPSDGQNGRAPGARTGGPKRR